MIEARAVVETRTVGAFVDIHVAMTASPSGLANASIIAHQVRARCRMNSAQGRRQLTFIHVRLTVPSYVSSRAETSVIADSVDARGDVVIR